MFDILREPSARVCDDRDKRHVELRSYGDRFNTQVREDLRSLLPKRRDRSFADYEQRVRERFGHGDWGIGSGDGRALWAGRTAWPSRHDVDTGAEQVRIELPPGMRVMNGAAGPNGELLGVVITDSGGGIRVAKPPMRTITASPVEADHDVLDRVGAREVDRSGLLA